MCPDQGGVCETAYTPWPVAGRRGQALRATRGSTAVARRAGTRQAAAAINTALDDVFVQFYPQLRGH